MTSSSSKVRHLGVFQIFSEMSESYQNLCTINKTNLLESKICKDWGLILHKSQNLTKTEFLAEITPNFVKTLFENIVAMETLSRIKQRIDAPKCSLIYFRKDNFGALLLKSLLSKIHLKSACLSRVKKSCAPC